MSPEIKGYARKILPWALFLVVLAILVHRETTVLQRFSACMDRVKVERK